MKTEIGYYLQSSMIFSLFGGAGSPLLIYEQLLSSGHIEKAIQAPVGEFSQLIGITINHDIRDAKMHESVELLKIMFDQIATKFYKAVVLDGSELLNHHKTIITSTSFSELDLNRMSVTLRGAKSSFKAVEDNMIGLQSELHFFIENRVRQRIREFNIEIDNNEMKRQNLEELIDTMEHEMSENEKQSSEYDRQANNNAYTARRMKEEAEDAGTWGAAQILGAVGSLAIGYATGGLAYAVVPAGILVTFGVSNANEAEKYRLEAESYRSEAVRYQRRAGELRINVRQTSMTLKQLKSDTKHITALLKQSEASLAKIKGFSDELHNSVHEIYGVIEKLQNMDVVIKNAELDTESLQQRLKQLPNVYKKAESVLKTTKAAWGTVQEVLKIQYKMLT